MLQVVRRFFAEEAEENLTDTVVLSEVPAAAEPADTEEPTASVAPSLRAAPALAAAPADAPVLAKRK